MHPAAAAASGAPPPHPATAAAAVAAAAAVSLGENDAAAELAALSRAMRLPFGDRAFAARLDDADTLAPFRSRFHIPAHGTPPAASRVAGGNGDGGGGRGDGGATEDRRPSPWGEHGGGDADGSGGEAAARPAGPLAPPAGETEQSDRVGRVPPPTPAPHDPPPPVPSSTCAATPWV